MNGFQFLLDGLTRATGYIVGVLGEVFYGGDLSDGVAPKVPIPTPPVKTPVDPVDTPNKTVPPRPKAPPTPKRPYVNPKPSPRQEPFPTIPPRKLPTPPPNTNQRSVDVTSNVSFGLATRTYGCMIYNPISSVPLTVYNCNSTTVYDEIAGEQQNSLIALIAWIANETDDLLNFLEQNPLLKVFIEGLGLGDGVETYLINKFCELSFVGLNILSRGGLGRIVSSPLYLAGCNSIVKLAVNYAVRADTSLRGFPLVTHSYTSITEGQCSVDITIDTPGDLPPELGFGDSSGDGDSCSPVLMPDSAAFINSGKYMVLYWVLKSNPTYKVYVTTTQLAKPIPAIWDVLDAEGKLIGSKANGVWNTYFAGIQRTIGYQYTRYYAEGYSKPVMSGYFKDKQDAEGTFTTLLALTELEARSKAPIIYSGSTKEDYLKELSHEGEKLILKKVVVIDKLPWKDSAKCVVTYTAKNAVQ